MCVCTQSNRVGEKRESKRERVKESTCRWLCEPLPLGACGLGIIGYSCVPHRREDVHRCEKERRVRLTLQRHFFHTRTVSRERETHTHRPVVPESFPARRPFSRDFTRAINFERIAGKSLSRGHRRSSQLLASQTRQGRRRVSLSLPARPSPTRWRSRETSVSIFVSLHLRNRFPLGQKKVSLFVVCTMRRAHDERLYVRNCQFSLLPAISTTLLPKHTRS